MRRVLPTFGLFIGGAALLAVGCGEPRARKVHETPPEVTLYGVRMTHHRDRHPAALGRAARVTYHRESGDLTAYESYFRFPNRHTPVRRGREPSGMEVRAPLVVGNLGTRRADAQGGVVLKTSTGIAGETERVFFDGAALTARGESRVKVLGPGYTLEADRFTLWFEPEEFTFEGNVASRLGGQK